LINGQTGDLISSLKIFDSHAVHGITTVQRDRSPDGEDHSSLFVLVWGGPLFQVVELSLSKPSSPGQNCRTSLITIGSVTSADDWILDAAFSGHDNNLDSRAQLRAGLITANDVFIHAQIELNTQDLLFPLADISLHRIPCGLKSILYSAHVVWLAANRAIIASGTVFGEVLVWSCQIGENHGTVLLTAQATRIHYAFTGHEGSVFGVHISPEYSLPGKSERIRFLASCSDDRTIRVWNISDLECNAELSTMKDTTTKGDIRPTGFQETRTAIEKMDSTNPFAMAWGHVSRIWDVRFLGTLNFAETIEIILLSRGEDATLQRWILNATRRHATGVTDTSALRLIDTSSQHSGKNLWSWAFLLNADHYTVFTGGADGRIVSTEYPLSSQSEIICGQWSVTDITKQVAVAGDQLTSIPDNFPPGKCQMKQYGFVSSNQFLAISQLGVIFLGTIDNLERRTNALPSSSPAPSWSTISWEILTCFEDLKSYSILSADSNLGIAVFGGVNSIARCYYHLQRRFYDVCVFTGKLSGLFILPATEEYSERSVLGHPGALFSLLVTLATSKIAFIFTICSKMDEASPGALIPHGPYQVPLFDTFDVTSALHLQQRLCLILGSRTGAYGFYDTTKLGPDTLRSVVCTRKLHHKDAITTIVSLPNPGVDSSSSLDYILTCGRDGYFRISSLGPQSHDHFTTPHVEPVHESPLPLGPSLEGIHVDPSSGDVLIYGFRSKEFVVWNESKQYAVMTVDCGGAHRTWTYSPPPSSGGSGTFLWTKASTFNIFSQPSLRSHSIQPGGHGREIKSISLFNPTNQGNVIKQRLLATGAEDTTIRIFTLPGNNNDVSKTFVHLRTLKKHTTGIQHLHFSSCGSYLFSSGGCSEFFVWRLSHIPTYGIAVHCEGICPIPDTEDSATPDLRITSFDILEIDSKLNLTKPREKQFLICMALSNSLVKVHHHPA
jgi:WD repeat-containing protein 6